MSAHRRDSNALWCPLCDVPSGECGQPEGYASYGEDDAHPHLQWVHGHAGHWVTDAERKQEIANDIARELPSGNAPA